MRINVTSLAVGDGGLVCDSGGATSIGPTMSRSPSLGNLPSHRGSLSVGILVSGAGSAGMTGDASALSSDACVEAMAVFFFHSASILSHFSSVNLYVLELVP
jgi:hypothetical protein